MIIYKDGKIFGKINIMTLLVLVIILVFLGGVGYKFSKSKMISPFTQTDKIEIEFYVSEAPEFVVNAIEKGDLVRDPIKNAVFGKVKEKKVREAETITIDSKGKINLTPKEGYNSVTLVVEGEGRYTDEGTVFDNVEYFIGKYTDLRVGNSSLGTRIKDIRMVQ